MALLLWPWESTMSRRPLLAALAALCLAACSAGAGSPSATPAALAVVPTPTPIIIYVTPPPMPTAAATPTKAPVYPPCTAAELSLYGGTAADCAAALAQHPALFATEPPTPKPTPAPTPRTLYSLKGSGIKTGKPFAIPDEDLSVELDYSFSCRAFGYAGNFQVYWYEPDGSLGDIAVNDLAMTGKSSTELYLDEGGPIHLEMNSECSWQVIVREDAP